MNYFHTLMKLVATKAYRIVLLAIFLVNGLSASAQTNAQGFFNAGAKEFIHSKLDKAIATVDQGLKKYPNDENLQELKEKLKEEKEKQDQNKDKQNKEDQNNKDQENKDKKNDDNKDDKKEEDKKKEEEQKDKDKEEEQKDQNKKNEEDKKQEQQQPQVGQMTPEQVKQLLETMNNEEAKTQKKVNAQKVKGKKIQQEKDW